MDKELQGKLRMVVIAEFPTYRISETGVVIAPRGNVMKATIKRNGYPTHTFFNKVRSLHRLLAIAFIPNPHNKPEVNHINGVKSDCRLENLEWVSRSENVRHAMGLNLIPFSQSGRSGKMSTRSKPVQMCDLNGNVIKEFESGRQAALTLGISINGIYDVIKGRYITSGGYKWLASKSSARLLNR